MKKILFVIFLFSLLVACKKEVSEMQSEYFVRFYGDALDDIASDVELTPSGGYAFAATTTRPLPRVDTDVMLVITDKFGFQVGNTIYFGGLGNETCNGLLVVNDGYVLTGSSNSGEADSVFLVKFNAEGIFDWRSSWVSTGQGKDIALIDNKIVVCGYTLDEGNLEIQYPMLSFFDLQGNLADIFPPKSDGYFTSILQRGNEVFGFGVLLENSSNPDLFIAGDGSDVYDFPLGGNESSSRIIPAENGGFFIVGTTDPIGSGFSQIIVKKINDQFTEDLSFNANPIGSDADFRGVDIQELADGSIAVLGDKTLSKDTDIVLYILNPDGTSRSSKIYGKTGNQSASSLKRTPDGGLVILGSNQQEKTNAMITLIKTDSEGNIWE
jgi:hypothetical protein